jgi:hypothetical protein
MTVAKGQAQQPYIEVVIKIKRDTSSSDGGESSSRATRRRCSVYGNVGHNSRTCQVVISSSKEDDDK